MFRTATFFCSLICLSLLCSTLPGQDDFRTWTSSGGGFSVEAQMVNVSGDEITLKKRDGKILKTELSKLSDADREFVQNKNATPAATNGPLKTKPLVSGAKDVDYPEDATWSVAADALVSKPSASSMVHALGDETYHEPFILGSRDRTVAVLFEKLRQRDNGSFRMINLTNGQEVVAKTSIPKCQPQDISPDKTRLAVVSDNGNFMSDRGALLNIVRIGGPEIKPLVSFTPYTKGDPIIYAKFVDNVHVLTCSRGGLVGLWNSNSLKLKWKTQIWPDSRPALSPNGKYVFARVEEDLAAIEALSGKVVGMKPCAEIGIKTLSVNDSGSKLVGVGCGVTRVWDLRSGKMVADFAISAAVQSGPVVWLNDDQFLACTKGYGKFDHNNFGMYDLVDLNLQCSVWVYKFLGGPIPGPGGKVWCKTNDYAKAHNPSLIGLTIPHQEAASLISRGASALKFDYDSTVPVALSVNGGQWDRAESAKSLKALFETSGLVTSAGSNPGFEARLRVGEASENMKAERLDTQLVDLVITSQENHVWRAVRDQWWYMENARDDFSKNPWRAIVLPKTFRFIKPTLDGSVASVDKGFVKLDFTRDYTHGTGEGFSIGSGKVRKEDLPPGWIIGPDGRPRPGNLPGDRRRRNGPGPSGIGK